MQRPDALELVPPPHLAIGGERVEVGAGVERRDPATGDVVGTLAMAGPGEVQDAVDAAGRAQAAWAAKPPATRRVALQRLAAAVRAHADELAALQTLEMGQPFAASRAGVLHAAEWYDHFAGWADKIDGRVVPVAPGRVLDYVTPEPIGVVGAIIPWNGPMIAAALKLAPALAAGNGIVLKPSEMAGFSSLLLAELCAEAGLPVGLVSVVPGDAVAGKALIEADGVGLVTFTGGSSTGAQVGAAAGARNLPTILELGGKSASLVFADADLKKAGKLGAILGVVQNSGQGCFLPTRMLVERSVHHEVVERVVATLEATPQGDPFDQDSSMGPLASHERQQAVLDTIDAARTRGDGTVVTGGTALDGPHAAGAYVRPTVFDDTDPVSPIAQEEVFGPVLCITPFDDEEQAVRIANTSRYGLAGYVWTRDLARAHRVADALDAGSVSVNSMSALPPGAPFGGRRDSGHGVEGGRWGLDEFLRLKNVHVAL